MRIISGGSSDETARVIDEEVQHLLHQNEDLCRIVLSDRRGALDLIARACSSTRPSTAPRSPS